MSMFDFDTRDLLSDKKLLNINVLGEKLQVNCDLTAKRLLYLLDKEKNHGLSSDDFFDTAMELIGEDIVNKWLENGLTAMAFLEISKKVFEKATSFDE
ncbi:MAG: hypothetical protein ACK5LV_04335 [Lachnospirales bacterium]